jgi:hypothetical protein
LRWFLQLLAPPHYGISRMAILGPLFVQLIWSFLGMGCDGTGVRTRGRFPYPEKVSIVRNDPENWRDHRRGVLNISRAVTDNLRPTWCISLYSEKNQKKANPLNTWTGDRSVVVVTVHTKKKYSNPTLSGRTSGHRAPSFIGPGSIGWLCID